jgi:hypothetical protein
MQENEQMWLQLHDGDGFPLFVNMDNVVDFRWYEREGYTCLLTTAPVAEKLHRLYVRENAEKIIALLRAEQDRLRLGSRGAA